MELVAQRESLLPALTHAASHAEARGAMPALKCVALHATADGVLHLGATDFVRTYQGSVRVEVKREGRAAVDAADLLAQVTAFPAKSEITLTVTDHKLALAAKRIRASLAGMDPETMPVLAGVADESGESDESVKPVKIPARALADALGHVRPAVAADQTRAHLHAVLLHGRVLVATDGHRMHKAMVPVELPKVLLPAEAVDAWRAALRDLKDEEVTLRASTANAPVTLVTPAGAFSSKTVDAAFPSYEQVIPAEQPWALEFNAGEVRASVRAMPTGLQTIVRFAVERDLTGAALVIDGESDGRAKRAEVACTVLRGAGEIPGRWGMGLSYLLDALSAAGDGVAILEGHGELDPLTVRVPGVEGFMAVVMPARV